MNKRRSLDLAIESGKAVDSTHSFVPSTPSQAFYNFSPSEFMHKTSCSPCDSLCSIEAVISSYSLNLVCELPLDICHMSIFVLVLMSNTNNEQSVGLVTAHYVSPDTMITVAAIFLALATSGVLLRFLARNMTGSKYYADDWLVLAALVSNRVSSCDEKGFYFCLTSTSHSAFV